MENLPSVRSILSLATGRQEFHFVMCRERGGSPQLHLCLRYRKVKWHCILSGHLADLLQTKHTRSITVKVRGGTSAVGSSHEHHRAVQSRGVQCSLDNRRVPLVQKSQCLRIFSTWRISAPLFSSFSLCSLFPVAALLKDLLPSSVLTLFLSNLLVTHKS